MSTLEECKNAGLLVTMGGNLSRHQNAERLLACGTEVKNNMVAVLPTLQSDGFFPGSARPREQAAVLFRNFIAGHPFNDPLPHEMHPLGQGIWRLKTPDLRFDGWFPDFNFFVIGAFDTKQNAKLNGRDDAMVAEVVALRTKTNLLGGAYRREENIHDLIRL